MDYPNNLVLHSHVEQCRQRLADATAIRDRVAGAVTDAERAVLAAMAARDVIVTKAARTGGVPPAHSIAAARAVADAETQLAFARDSQAAAERGWAEAQRAVSVAQSEAHRPVLEHGIAQRIAAAALIDEAELLLAKATVAYAKATDTIAAAMAHGLRVPDGPYLSRGPYGREPGEHEAAERAAWGRLAATPAKAA